MARVNVEERAFTDPRCDALATLRGVDPIGPLPRVWHLAGHRRSALLSDVLIDGAARLPGFAAAMVAVGLARRIAPGEVEICGKALAVDWLLKLDAKSAAGVIAANLKRAGKQPGGQPPGQPPGQPVGSTGSQNQPVGQPGGQPSFSFSFSSDPEEKEIPGAPSASGAVAESPDRSTKKKPPKKPAKTYHPAEAFAPGASGLGQLGFPSLVSSDAWSAILGELDVVHRNERPAGRQFLALLNWIRPKLATELRAQQGGYGRWGGRSGKPAGKIYVEPTPDKIFGDEGIDVHEANLKRTAEILARRGA